MNLAFFSLGCILIFAQVPPANELLEALNKAESAIAENSDDYTAHNTRGNLLKQLGRYDQAVVAFSTGVDVIFRQAGAAKDPNLDAVKVLMRGDLTRLDQARQFSHRKILALLLGNRADAYRNLIEKFPQAKINMFDDLTRSIHLHLEEPRYKLARGQQNYLFERFPEALADFSEVLKQQPNSIDAFRGRILSAYELKDWDVIWQDAQALRDQGTPIDEATLAKWRKESGRDYPDAKKKRAADDK